MKLKSNDGQATIECNDKHGAALIASGKYFRMPAEGCCSSISPCSHQQRDQFSICEVCTKALAHTNGDRASG